MISTKKRNPFLNINIPDFREETCSMGLSAKGAYLELMLYANQHDGIVPGDEESLRKIAGANVRVWKQIREQVLAVLEACDGGYLIHHAATSAERYRQYMEAGAKGGKAKNANRTAQPGVPAGRPGDEPKSLKTNDEILATLGQTTNYKRQIQKENIYLSCSEDFLPEDRNDREAASNKRAASFPASTDTPAKKGTAAAGGFEEFWAAYPKHEKIADGRAAYAALIASGKVTHRRLTRAVASYDKSKHGDQRNFFLQAHNWINDGGYLEHLPRLPSPEDLRSYSDGFWRGGLEYLKQNGCWNEELYGPPPGEADCLVPEHILNEEAKLKEYQEAMDAIDAADFGPEDDIPDELFDAVEPELPDEYRDQIRQVNERLQGIPTFGVDKSEAD